jgi:hypothetical protein
MTEQAGYLQSLTAEHLAAASSALREVARLVSVEGQPGDRSVRRVRVGHIDHGAFLSLELRSFAMMEVDQQGLLLDPDSGEVILAMVANHPVSVQITTLLAFLANFLARQDLTSEMRSGDRGIDDIDALALTADALATQQVEDDLRIGNWEQAARRLSSRASNSRFALEVRIAEPLMQPEEIALRVPLLRRVYNTQPRIREAIDRVTGLSLALRIGGDDIPPEVFRQMQAQVDVGRLQKFIAHLMRDTFVCGNGYLAFSNSDHSPMRLLVPEFVRHVNDGYQLYDAVSGQFQLIEGQVLHLTGAKQVGSDYGLSLLEPFVQIATTNETLDSAVNDVALAQPPIDRVDEAAAWLKQVVDLRERTFADSAERIAETLGGATRSFRNPSGEELYFPGLELMSNAAERLQFRDAAQRDARTQ